MSDGWDQDGKGALSPRSLPEASPQLEARIPAHLLWRLQEDKIPYLYYILHMNNVKIEMSQAGGLNVSDHGRALLLSLTFSGRLCLQRRLPNFLYSGGLEFYRISCKPVGCPPKYWRYWLLNLPESWLAEKLVTALSEKLTPNLLGVLLQVLNLYRIPFNKSQLHSILAHPEILLFVEAKSKHPFVSLRAVPVRLEPSPVPTTFLSQGWALSEDRRWLLC